MGKQAAYSKGLALSAEGISIRAFKDGAQVPVLTLQNLDSEQNRLGSMEKLADNVISLLNGHHPAHRLEPSEHSRIYFQRAASGLILRLQPEGQGLSQPAIGIFATGGDDALSSKALNEMDNLFMKALCDTLNPSAAPHPGSSGGPRPGTPQP